MHPLSFISMLLISSFSFVLIRVLAPFQETSNLKYISLKSDFLAKCLIPKKKGYVKVNDRKKISLFSLIFSFLFVILVLVLLLMVILPPIPCEPFTATFGRRRPVVEWVVNTVNEKIIWGLPMLFFCTELISFLLLGAPGIIKSKTESKKSLLGLFAVLLLLAGLSLCLIFQLFL